MTSNTTSPPPGEPQASDIRLDGRRIFVTGGARGLGEAFVRAAHAAGAQTVFGDVLAERGQALAAELGGSVRFVNLDMRNPESIRTAIDSAAMHLGGLDGLVNNAAVTNSGGRDLDQIDLDTWDSVMAVNVRGPWLASCAARPHLKASGSGRIVNIASDTALWGAPRLMAYVASKGAIISMTRSMARELGPDHITVNAIAPGLTLVEATEYVPRARHDHYLQGRALPREQLPGDVTGSVLFLLSRASGFVTGQLLAVNGGFVMH
jgi:NAD(P)-dependent dehydrogenase (short-subunit alcohol dehydrogenase family)